MGDTVVVELLRCSHICLWLLALVWPPVNPPPAEDILNQNAEQNIKQLTRQLTGHLMNPSAKQPTHSLAPLPTRPSTRPRTGRSVPPPTRRSAHRPVTATTRSSSVSRFL